MGDAKKKMKSEAELSETKPLEDGKDQPQYEPSEYYDTPTTAFNFVNEPTEKTQSVQTQLLGIKPTLIDKKRRIYLMRSAERIDDLYDNWVKLSHPDSEEYHPFDLNMGTTLPKREGAPKVFNDDPPITELGFAAAQLVGRGIRLSKINFSGVYVSPALRCIQTAYGIFKGLNFTYKINVEPGLFDWLSLYNTFPKFMTHKELSKADLSVSEEYRPIMQEKELKGRVEETGDEYYKRVEEVTRKINKNHFKPGPILIIAQSTPHLELSWEGKQEKVWISQLWQTWECPTLTAPLPASERYLQNTGDECTIRFPPSLTLPPSAAESTMISSEDSTNITVIPFLVSLSHLLVE